MSDDELTGRDLLKELESTLHPLAIASLREIKAQADRIAKLEAALRYALEAIETGRSEPLFVARDHIRNTLDEALGRGE